MASFSLKKMESRCNEQKIPSVKTWLSCRSSSPQSRYRKLLPRFTNDLPPPPHSANPSKVFDSFSILQQRPSSAMFQYNIWFLVCCNSCNFDSIDKSYIMRSPHVTRTAMATWGTGTRTPSLRFRIKQRRISRTASLAPFVRKTLSGSEG